MLEANADVNIAAHQKLHVTYEDFVCSPNSITQGICKLLGLAWEAGMANPYESQSVHTFESHDGEIATTDPKLLKRKTIEPASAEKWRSVRPVAPLATAACGVAAQMGYDTGVACRATGNSGAMPLVYLHGSDGRCAWSLNLARRLPTTTPFYTLEAEYLHSSNPEHLMSNDLKQYGIRLAARIACTVVTRLANSQLSALDGGPNWKSEHAPTPIAIMGASWGCLLVNYVAAGAAYVSSDFREVDVLSAAWRPAGLVLIDPPPHAARWRPLKKPEQAIILSTILNEFVATAPEGLAIEPPVIKDTSEQHALAVALAYLDELDELQAAVGTLPEQQVARRSTFMREYAARWHLRRMTLEETQGSVQERYSEWSSSDAADSCCRALVLSSDRSWFVDDESCNEVPKPQNDVIVAVGREEDDASSVAEMSREADIVLTLDGSHVDVCRACVGRGDEGFLAMLGMVLGE